MTANRINGARVKAAARTHAQKQLRNLGFVFADSAASATFKGETAYAQWQAGLENRVLRFGINYPGLPDNAMLSRKEADLIAAYTLHELGHVAYTDNSITRIDDRLLFQLWNGVEDARIEHAVIMSGKARGARSMFKKLISKYTTTHLGDHFNPTSINSASFALALVCRAAYGNGNGFANKLLSRIPAPYHGWYTKAADDVVSLPLDRSGTAGAMRIAQEFLDAWKAAFPDAFQQPEPDPTDPQPPTPTQPSDEYDEDDGSDAKEDFGLGERVDPHDDEPSEDELDFDLGGPESDEEADAKQALADALSETTEQTPEQADDSLFASSDEDADEDSDGCKGSGMDSEPFIPVENDKYEETRAIQPEPSVDDVFQSARARTKDAIDLPSRSTATRSYMSRWRNMIGKDETAIRRAAKKLHKATLPALKAQLYRILKAPEVCGWDGGALGGRFDGKRAPRMFAGSEQVFKRRWLSEGIDTAVSVVVDMSGSMNGESMKQAVDLAYTIAEACESARADVEVVGFRTNDHPDNESYWGSYSLSGEYMRTEGASSALLVVAKTFKDKLERVAHHFAFLKQCAAGGTPDYSAVKTVCEQMSNLPHQRKVVIVITDGFGESAGGEYCETRKRVRTNWLMRTLSDASHQLYGCDVIGFGIYCSPSDFADAYPIGAPVHLDDLHRTALKSVIKQLESRDHRRVA